MHSCVPGGSQFRCPTGNCSQGFYPSVTRGCYPHPKDSIRIRTLGVPRAAVRVSHQTPLEFYSRTSSRASSTRIITRWVLPTCEFYSHHNIYHLWEFRLHLFLSSYELPSVKHLLVRQILILRGDFTQIPKLLLKGLTLDPLT